MKRQGKNYWCGVASIANALEVLGIKRSQREIARLCSVDHDGHTDETEMKRALLANGVWVDETPASERTSQVWAISWLRRHTLTYGPVILCVDNDEHWVTVIGYCGGKYIVFDPSRNQGIEVHEYDSLAGRWQNSEGDFYGIGISLAR